MVGPGGQRGPGWSGALGDRVDLIRDKPVRLAVHRGRRFRVRGVDQAEDLAAVLVHPVAQVMNAVSVLGLQVGGVGLGHVVQADRSAERVRVHEQCQGWFLLPSFPVPAGLAAGKANRGGTGHHIGEAPYLGSIYLGSMTPSRSAAATARDRVGSLSLRSTAETW